jgi:hypothetical protein
LKLGGGKCDLIINYIQKEKEKEKETEKEKERERYQTWF